MSESSKVPGEVPRQFESYSAAFKVYEDGKHRRYGLLFSVNGGAVATAKLFSEPANLTYLGHLTVPQVAGGMIVFTLLMWWDIWTFAERMRQATGDYRRPLSEGTFSLPGRIVLSAICLLIICGWHRVIW